MSGDFSIVSPGPIALIGDAIADRLRLAFDPRKFEHQFVPAKLDGAAWTKLLRRTPFVGLGFSEIDPLHESGSTFNGPVKWVIFLVTKNERGPRERFYGDKFAPGVLQMMQVAVAFLQGYALKAGGVTLGTVGALRAANSFGEDWKDDTLAMIQVGLSVTITFGIADVIEGEATQAATLAGASVKWSFDGGAVTALTENVTGGV